MRVLTARFKTTITSKSDLCTLGLECLHAPSTIGSLIPNFALNQRREHAATAKLLGILAVQIGTKSILMFAVRVKNLERLNFLGKKKLK